jgi:hypothetical protein
MGDNAYGRHWLAVSPSGEWRIHWADNNQPWDPWEKDAEIIGIPALDPEGSGQASEDAEDMLKCMGLYEQAKELCEAEDIGWVEAAERLATDDWAYNRGEALDWLAEALLSACNGEGSELNMLAPWGYTADNEYGPEYEQEPPFSFEWK